MERPTVFISYAHEDYPAACRLYDGLSQAGVAPWLDKKSLLPGQRWRSAIQGAIRNSRYFVAVLSSRSMERKGYVHRELRAALDVLEEFPEDDIFVIPIRLDDCQPSHEKLRDLHYVDLFPSWDEGFESVLQAIGASRSPATGRPAVHGGLGTPTSARTPEAKSAPHPRPLNQAPPHPPVPTEAWQSLAALDRIIHDAEIDQNFASVQSRFLRWKERTSRSIKETFGEAQATAFSSITAPNFISGPQPRLMSEARQCRSHLTALLGPTEQG